MIRHSSGTAVILVAFLALGSRTSAMAQERPGLDFTGLITAAEAVVAVEILSTDYTATPSDGPMVADAKVLKVLKGPFTTGKKFSFWETAWVGPAYQKGEYRILFLEQAKPTESGKTTRWWILSNLYARTDFFIEKGSVAALSAESLESFLKEIQESKPRPKKILFPVSVAR
jgi:hypothetical protein